jgi:Transposase DDE domain group 1
MIWLLRPDQPKTTEFAPAMDDSTGILPGIPAVKGKPVHVAFDGGRMTSDAGILLLAAVEQRLGIAERLADCIEDPRAPERVRHGLAEMIRYRALLIAAGYPDGNDCDALKSDPALKMAVGRLPESGTDLCSQPTISRLENLPGPTALKRMMAAMVDLFCDSFKEVPRRIVLDIDDTEDRVHGGQQLALFNAYYDSRCFQPIHIYEATTAKPVAIILRPGKTPDGTEVTLVLRHVIGHIRARWPAIDIVVRGDSHYARPEAMAWCERKRIGYIFGLAGNSVLLRRAGPLAEDAALGRIDGEADMVRRYGELRGHVTADRGRAERVPPSRCRSRALRGRRLQNRCGRPENHHSRPIFCNASSGGNRGAGGHNILPNSMRQRPVANRPTRAGALSRDRSR